MKTILATTLLSLLSASVPGFPGIAIGILAVILLIIYGVRRHVEEMRDNPKRRYDQM
jgi:type III secretory pathway component EscV